MAGHLKSHLSEVGCAVDQHVMIGEQVPFVSQVMNWDPITQGTWLYT